MKRYPSNVYDGFCTGSRYYVYDESDCSQHDFSRRCDALRYARRLVRASVFERLDYVQRKWYSLINGIVVGYYDGISFVTDLEALDIIESNSHES